MSAQILDGNLVANIVKEQAKRDVLALKARGIQPGLGTLLVGSDPGSVSYVRGKHRDCADVGIASIQVELPETASFNEIAKAIRDLNDAPECSAYIVQLPLPSDIDAVAMLQMINPEKDADGLHPENLGLLVHQRPRVLPCTPAGIVELLDHYDIALAGKHVVVIGRGITVGRPLGLLLSQKGVDATVTLCHSRTPDLRSFTSRADVVIAATGVAQSISAADIKPGAVCIDVGITRVGNRLVGDFNPDIADIASWFTPMPGGTGPMTRAMLLANVIRLAT